MPTFIEEADAPPVTEEELELSTNAGRLLRASSLTVAVAESCTAGMLGAYLTAPSGSSEYFLGGVIAYSDSLKASLLNVPPTIIHEYGAVSAECALLMAKGVIQATGASIGVSVTGIAGPTGGTAFKPVGTTYIAIAAPHLEHVECFTWGGDREENRRRSVVAALNMLTDCLRSEAGAQAEPSLAQG